VSFDPTRDYPLGTNRPDLVSTQGGLPLSEVTLAALRAGRLGSGEIRATPETLRLQAEIARAAGREPLAESLDRAAELAAVPDDLLLAVYTALRPRRATAQELDAWAARLEAHGASRTASFVREAAAAYEERGLLAPPFADPESADADPGSRQTPKAAACAAGGDEERGSPGAHRASHA
jgi:propanediol dehydratase small subunit